MLSIKTITVRLLVASLAIIGVPACRDAGRSAEPVVITCPPHMSRAAKQSIGLDGSCGNGIVDADEVCDDGNVIAGDGCGPDCRSTESCGNGTVDHTVGEVYDDGNTGSDDRFCSDCRSCPEFAVLTVGALEAPAMVHAATEPGPCPAASPVPEVTQAVAVQEALEVAQASSGSTRAHTGLRPIRLAALSDPARGRLAEQSHVHMSEELTLARSTIAELEQRNAELRQSLDDQLRQLEEMQQRLIRGAALQ